MKHRIMYIESKAQGLAGGEARIGRVTYSKSGKSLYYRGRTYHRIEGGGATKSNFCEEASGDEYWITGPKRNGGDRLYNERVPVDIDEDIRREYWEEIRGMPDDIDRPTA